MTDLIIKFENLFAISHEFRTACFNSTWFQEKDSCIHGLLQEALDIEMSELDCLGANEISSAHLAILQRYAVFIAWIYREANLEIKGSIALSQLFIRLILEVIDCCKLLDACEYTTGMSHRHEIQRMYEILSQQEKIKNLLSLSKMNLMEFLDSFVNRDDLMQFLQVFNLPFCEGLTAEELVILAKYLRSYLSCRYAHVVVNGKVNLAFEDYLEHIEMDLPWLENYYHVIEKFFVRVFEDINDKLIKPNELRDVWVSLPADLQKECMKHEDSLKQFIQTLLVDNQYGSEEYGVVPDILELLFDYQDKEDVRQKIWWAIMEAPDQTLNKIANLAKAGELSLNITRPLPTDFFRGNTPSPVKQLGFRSISPSH